MSDTVDIHKAAGILISNRKLLVERSIGKEHFIAPGGSIEAGETPTEALVRELQEEFQIQTDEADFEPFGTFYAAAAGQENKRLRMDVFIVKNWQGKATPDNEVEEIKWITSSDAANLKLGSVFAHDVVPRLKDADLID